MNELEQQLAKVVEKAISIAEQTGEFAIEQAPLLLQEFYAWHITQRIFYIVMAFLVYLILSKIKYFFGKKEPFKIKGREFGNKFERESVLIDGRYFDPRNDYQVGWFVFKYVSYVIPTIILLENIYLIVFIVIAPKLYLIEYFLK